MAPLIFNLNMVRCCSTICFSLAVNFFVYVARYSTSRSFLFSFFSFGFASNFAFFLLFPFACKLVELVLGSCPEDDETGKRGSFFFLSKDNRRFASFLRDAMRAVATFEAPLFNEEPASLSLLVAKTFSTNCSSVKDVSTVAV